MAENLSLVAQLIIDRTKALVAIQELHRLEYEVRPLYPTSNYNAEPAGTAEYRICANCKTYYPCATRRLADQGLGDNLARTTKNGENNE